MRTVHVVGDSISIDYGPYLERYLAPHCGYSRRAESIGYPDNALGFPGDSPGVSGYLGDCLRQGRHWNLLAVNCGLHDLRQYDGQYQVGLDDYKKNVTKILEQSRALADQTLWSRITPVDDEMHNSLQSDFIRLNADIEQYNQAADEIAHAQGVGIIDLYELCRAEGGAEIYRDHAHFTVEVSKLQAAFIAGHILAALDLNQ